MMFAYNIFITWPKEHKSKLMELAKEQDIELNIASSKETGTNDATISLFTITTSLEIRSLIDKLDFILMDAKIDFNSVIVANSIISMCVAGKIWPKKKIKDYKYKNKLELSKLRLVSSKDDGIIDDEKPKNLN